MTWKLDEFSNHPDDKITKISPDTKKSLGDLRRLAVTIHLSEMVTKLSDTRKQERYIVKSPLTKDQYQYQYVSDILTPNKRKKTQDKHINT